MEQQVITNPLLLNYVDSKALHQKVQQGVLDSETATTELQKLHEKCVSLNSSSSLSLGVSKLISQDEVEESLRAESESLQFFNCEEGFLNLDVFRTLYFEHFAPCTVLEDKYQKSSKFVKQVASPKVHEQFVALFADKATRSQKFKQLYEKLSQDVHEDFAMLSKLFELHMASVDAGNEDGATVGSFIAFSILSTQAERLISSIFLSASQNKIPIPTTLSEILVTKEVDLVLSEENVFLTKTIIGPPIALNLRNVIWHGFLGPKEFQISFTSFLFALYFALAQRAVTRIAQISEQAETPEQKITWIPKPYSTSLVDKFQHHSFDFGKGAMVWDSEKLISSPEAAQDFMKDLKTILASSYFTVPGREGLVVRAFEEFIYNKQRLIPCAILLPLIEQGLRRLFIIANAPLINENIINAHSKVLYTILNIIMAHGIPKVPLNLTNTATSTTTGATEGESENTEASLDNINAKDLTINKLIPEMGEHLYHAVMDMAMHYEGLRFRDRVAHCEIRDADIPNVVVERILGTYVALCMRFDVRSPVSTTLKHSKKTEAEKEVVYLQKLTSPMQSIYQYFYHPYVGTFHPKAKLFFELKDFIIRTLQFSNDSFKEEEYKQKVKELEEYECQFTKKNFLITKIEEGSTGTTTTAEGQTTQDAAVALMFTGLPAQKWNPKLKTKTTAKPVISVGEFAAFIANMRKHLQSKYEKNLFFASQDLHQTLAASSATSSSDSILHLYFSVSHQEDAESERWIEDFELHNLERRQQYFNNIGLCRKILPELLEIQTVFAEKIVHLQQQIDERKARTPHRKLFTVMMQSKAAILEFTHLFLTLLDVEIYESSKNVRDESYSLLKKHKFLSNLHTQANRLNLSMKEGTIGATLHKTGQFLADSIYFLQLE